METPSTEIFAHQWHWRATAPVLIPRLCEEVVRVAEVVFRIPLHARIVIAAGQRPRNDQQRPVEVRSLIPVSFRSSASPSPMRKARIVARRSTKNVQSSAGGTWRVESAEDHLTVVAKPIQFKCVKW